MRNREITWYELLGVAPDADTAMINEAYERCVAELSRVNRGQKPSAEQQQHLELLELALETLSDETRRADYDRWLAITRELGALTEATTLPPMIVPKGLSDDEVQRAIQVIEAAYESRLAQIEMKNQEGMVQFEQEYLERETAAKLSFDLAEGNIRQSFQQQMKRVEDGLATKPDYQTRQMLQVAAYRARQDADVALYQAKKRRDMALYQANQERMVALSRLRQVRELALYYAQQERDVQIHEVRLGRR